MRLLIPCSKCGIELEASEEMIEEARNMGVALRVEHDVCPTDMPNLRRFKIKVEVFELVPDSNEVWVQVAGAGGTAEAPTFTLAIPALHSSLNEQWVKVTQMASAVDSDPVKPR